MKTRTISAVIMLIIGMICLCLGWYGMSVFVLFVSAVGLYEIYKAFEEKGYHPIKIGYAYLLLMILQIITKSAEITNIYFEPFGNFNISSFLQIVILMAILSVTVFRHGSFTAVDAALTVFAGYYVVVLPGYFISPLSFKQGRWIFLIALIGAIASDTFAYLVGRALGKHKLIPEVSPKKTVEGSVGSFVATPIVLTIYGIIVIKTGVCTGLAIYHYPIIGLLASALGQLGDLVASAMKRYTGIKDFGHLIPGHGGVLDRIDGYLFVFPMVFFYALFAGV